MKCFRYLSCNVNKYCSSQSLVASSKRKSHPAASDLETLMRLYQSILLIKKEHIKWIIMFSHIFINNHVVISNRYYLLLLHKITIININE